MSVIHYTDALEKLLKHQGEECLALRWAHDESQRWCSTWDARFQIPSIILSFLSGTGAVGSQTLLPFDGGMMVVGFISVLVGIMGSVQSYLSFARRAEAHRIAALSYERLHREIALELSLPRSERSPPEKLIERLRQEIDTLNETAPLLPETIKVKFKAHFPDLGAYNLPPSLNGLDPIEIAPEPQILSPEPARPTVRIAVV